MKRSYQKVLKSHLEQRLRGISPEIVGETPRTGWVRSMRLALGMSGAQLARRLGISAPSVSDLERREVAGTISLASLRKAAEAMQCDVVYVFVPKKPIDALLLDRAREVATAKVSRVSHSMDLEQQTNSEAYRSTMIDQEVSRLLSERSRELWNEST